MLFARVLKYLWQRKNKPIINTLYGAENSFLNKLWKLKLLLVFIALCSGMRDIMKVSEMNALCLKMSPEYFNQLLNIKICISTNKTNFLCAKRNDFTSRGKNYWNGLFMKPSCSVKWMMWWTPHSTNQPLLADLDTSILSSHFDSPVRRPVLCKAWLKPVLAVTFTRALLWTESLRNCMLH